MSVPTNGFVLSIRTSTGPDVFTPIAKCGKVTPPPETLKTEEYYADGTGVPTVVATTFELPEVTLELMFDPVVPTAPAIAHDALRTKLRAKTVDTYRIALADTGAFQWEFPALVTKFEIGELTQEGGIVTATVTLKQTALATVTP